MPSLFLGRPSFSNFSCKMIVCPKLKSAGICQNQNCRYRHNVKICLPCGVVCDPAGNYRAHVRGKAHKKRTNVGRRLFYCSVCLLNVTEAEWDKHVSGLKHIGTATNKGVSSDVRPEEGILPAHLRLCVPCDRIIPKTAWSAHLNGAPHRKMQTFVTYRAAFEEAEKDKNGIEISHGEDGVDFDVVEVANATAGVNKHVIIKNTVPQSRIEVLQVRLASTMANVPSPQVAYCSHRIFNALTSLLQVCCYPAKFCNAPCHGTGVPCCRQLQASK